MSDTKGTHSGEPSLPRGAPLRLPHQHLDSKQPSLLFAYLGIFIFGYDAGVAGGLVGLPHFKEAFGYDAFSPAKQADVQSWIVSILMLGAFVGALIGAPTCQRIGRKYGLYVHVTVFAIGAAVQTATNSQLSYLYAGRFIAGMGVGAMSTICPLYVAEMAPKEVRGRITGMFQIVVVVGVAASYWLEYGLTVHIPDSELQWRFPLAFQIVPAGIMMCLLPFICESPRWLIYRGRHEEAMKNLAWARKRDPTDSRVIEEIAEITAALNEERERTQGATFAQIWAPGNRIRFVIAFTMFLLQQWSGQNSISYYAPLVFRSIGLRGTSTGLLASGIYGIVKIVATSIFIFWGVEKAGRSKSLGYGGAGMSLFLWIIAAIFLTNIPDPAALSPPPASIAMAAMIYCFVIPYCFSWGPVPWVYCSEIFPMNVRHYGMATASATQWIFNFTISKVTPTLVLKLPNGRLFLLFAAINVVMSIYGFCLPETAGISIEQMDVVFGSVSKEERERDIREQIQAATGHQASLHGADLEKNGHVHKESV